MIKWVCHSIVKTIPTQDEVGMLKIESIEDAYQYALKVEDKLKRKIQTNSKGKEKLNSSTLAKPGIEKD